MSQGVDPHSFTNKLEEIIGRELRERADDFSGELISAPAIDCHPWHGSIDLCFLTPQDSMGKWHLADWKYFQFTDPNASGGWEETQGLGLLMREEWEACFRDGDSECEGAQAELIADKFFTCCAAALKSAGVQQALTYYKLTNDFEVWVGSPDDPSDRNYCDIFQ
ncbi:MAG TPA: hypothetical protein V6D15_11630 [Oculatellaceae cyanobacterium]|jgi:hypothetical protein